MVVDGRGKRTDEVALTTIHGNIDIRCAALRRGILDLIDRRGDFRACDVWQMRRGQVFIRDGHIGFGDFDPFGVDPLFRGPRGDERNDHGKFIENSGANRVEFGVVDSVEAAEPGVGFVLGFELQPRLPLIARGGWRAGVKSTRVSICTHSRLPSFARVRDFLGNDLSRIAVTVCFFFGPLPPFIQSTSSVPERQVGVGCWKESVNGRRQATREEGREPQRHAIAPPTASHGIRPVRISSGTRWHRV